MDKTQLYIYAAAMTTWSQQVMLMALRGTLGHWRHAEEEARWLDLSLRWMHCGFPQVIPSHRLASSLAATSLPRESASDVAVPWPAFLVAVPSGTFPGGFCQGDEVEAIWVITDAGGYLPPQGECSVPAAIVVVYKSQQVMVRTGSDHGEFAVDGMELHDPLEEIANNPEAARTLRMAGFLAVGTMLELDTPAMRGRIHEGPPRPSKRRPGTGPKAWTFTLARDVKVDVREAVRSYCLVGAGKSPTIQTLVRGHHKRQVCGPGLSDRKWIQVEPYWRGPEDAPIGVRSHVVTG